MVNIFSNPWKLAMILMSSIWKLIKFGSQSPLTNFVFIHIRKTTLVSWTYWIYFSIHGYVSFLSIEMSSSLFGENLNSCRNLDVWDLGYLLLMNMSMWMGECMKTPYTISLYVWQWEDFWTKYNLSEDNFDLCE